MAHGKSQTPKGAHPSHMHSYGFKRKSFLLCDLILFFAGFAWKKNKIVHAENAKFYIRPQRLNGMKLAVGF